VQLNLTEVDDLKNEAEGERERSFFARSKATGTKAKNWSCMSGPEMTG
jgi:hypothetical protein